MIVIQLVGACEKTLPYSADPNRVIGQHETRVR